MHEQLQKRLAELKQEYRAGQLQMSELETQQTRLRETMLRIRGAIQVLEEVLKSGESSPAS